MEHVGRLSDPTRAPPVIGLDRRWQRSTSESVSAIIKAMLDGTILSDDLIAQMTTPVLDVDYGLGINNDDIEGVVVYSHGGGVPGFRSQAGYLPDHDISYAVSTNLIPLPEGADVGDLQRQIVPLLIAALRED